jgi:F0F1-type ATP synthase assembly protein I
MNEAHMPPQGPDRRQLGTYYAIAQVGLEMVVPIGIGWWADEQLGWAPWLLILGVILGFVLGIGHLVALTRDVDAPGTDAGKGRHDSSGEKAK